MVLHYTAMTSARAALERLCDPVAEVSAHYLIGGDGTLWQMVAEDRRAWHAGAGEWCGLDDINSRSIGIELDNRGDHPFAARQMDVLEELLKGIFERWSIGGAAVIGHSDMAPGRKVDPGPRFDWERLERQGLAMRRGVDKGPRDPNFDSWRELARDAGYTASVDDEVLLEAVRLRFRPGARGPLSMDDYKVITRTGH